MGAITAPNPPPPRGPPPPPLPPPADEPPRPPRERLVDPAHHAIGIASVDDRARHDGVEGRIPVDHRARLVGERVAHAPVDVAVHDHALHRDARLASLVVASHRAARRRVVEVGVGQHDRRRVSAQLEHDALPAGVALHPPADLGAPGEAEETEAVVLDQALAHAAIAHHHVEPARGDARFVGDLGEEQRREGRRRRGLDHVGTAGRNGRAHLVSDQVEGKVERGDGGHRPHREATGETEPSVPRPGRVEGNLRARETTRRVSAGAEGVDRSRHFDAGIRDGLARLALEGARELLAPTRDAHRDTLQDPGPRLPRQRAHRRLRPDRRLDGGVDRSGVRQGDLSDLGAVERTDDRQRLPSPTRLAPHEVTEALHPVLLGRL